MKPATPHTRAPLDTVTHFETPEGVELELRAAGPAVRAAAWAVDGVIRLIMLFVCMIPLGMLGRTGMAIYLVVLFLLLWIYPVFFEAKRGATPGKSAFGLRVVHVDGTPVGWPAAFVRNILRAADLLPMGYAVGLVTMLVQPGFRRLGDLAAGTLVIHVERERRRHETLPAEPVPVAVPLRPEEQRALADFAARAHALGPSRAAELAGTLEPLTGHRDTPEAVAALCGMARWLQERR